MVAACAGSGQETQALVDDPPAESSEDSDSDSDSNGCDKVEICHNVDNNPHTIKVCDEALDAHLSHGDTEGPCPGDDGSSDDDSSSDCDEEPTPTPPE